MEFCKHCGAVLPPEASLCPACGAAVKPAAAAPLQTKPELTTEPDLFKDKPAAPEAPAGAPAAPEAQNPAAAARQPDPAQQAPFTPPAAPEPPTLPPEPPVPPAHGGPAYANPAAAQPNPNQAGGYGAGPACAAPPRGPQPPQGDPYAAYNQPQGPYYGGQPVRYMPEELSTAGYLGTLLLFLIPVVGLVLMLVWSFGGDVKPERKKLARAYLIRTLILLAIAVVVIIAIACLVAGYSTIVYNSPFYY